AGENGIRSPSKNGFAAHGLIDAVNLRLAALVAPDESRTNHAIVRVEHHKPVHLSGKTNALYVLSGKPGFFQHTAHRLPHRVPPILRPLFGPQRTPHPDVFVWSGERSNDLASVVNEESARASGSDIDAKPRGHA